jgi:hypothetical protein
MSDTENISLMVKNYPIHILVPKIDNTFSFEVSNNSQSVKELIINVSGENLGFESQNSIGTKFKLNPSEKNSFSLNLIPEIDGTGKLILDISRIKEVEYTTKVQKVRDVVVKSDASKVFKAYKLKYPDFSDNFNPDKYILKSSKKEIKNLEKDLEKKMELFGISDDLDPSILKPTSEELDSLKVKLIKSYIGIEKPEGSLKLIDTLSNKKLKKKLKNKVLRAYGTLNFENAINIGAQVLNRKNLPKVIPKIFQYNIKKDPHKALVLLKKFEDHEFTNDLILLFIRQSMEDHLNLILENIGFIKNDSLRLKILFNLLEFLCSKEDNVEKIKEILNLIIKTSLSKNIDIEDKKSNEFYSYLKDAVHIYAILNKNKIHLISYLQYQYFLIEKF